jgi:SAM-dependent methyltransferase
MKDRDRHYHGIAETFDAKAGEQSSALTHHSLSKKDPIRERIHAVLDVHVPAEGLVLDLGCGAGDDTLHLLHRGNSVIAIDVSPAMIERAEARAVHAGHRVHRGFHVSPVGALDDVLSRVGVRSGSVVGAISSLGVLNHEPQLHRLGAALRGALAPGACLVTTVMGRVSPWRLLRAPFEGQAESAIRRLIAGRGELTEGESCAAIQYFFPGSFSRALGPGFRVVDLQPLEWLSPPGDLAPTGATLGWIARKLGEIETRIGGHRAMTWMGDHFLMALERLP